MLYVTRLDKVEMDQEDDYEPGAEEGFADGSGNGRQAGHAGVSVVK